MSDSRRPTEGFMSGRHNFIIITENSVEEKLPNWFLCYNTCFYKVSSGEYVFLPLSRAGNFLGRKRTQKSCACSPWTSIPDPAHAPSAGAAP